MSFDLLGESISFASGRGRRLQETRMRLALALGLLSAVAAAGFCVAVMFAMPAAIKEAKAPSIGFVGASIAFFAFCYWQAVRLTWRERAALDADIKELNERQEALKKAEIASLGAKKP